MLGTHDRLFTKPTLLLLTAVLPNTTSAMSSMSNKISPPSETSHGITTQGMCWLLLTLIFCVLGGIALSRMPSPVKTKHVPSPLNQPLTLLTRLTWFPSFFHGLDIVKSARMIEQNNIMLGLVVALCFWMWDMRRLLAELFYSVLDPPDHWPGPVTCTCAHDGYSRQYSYEKHKSGHARPR